MSLIMVKSAGTFFAALLILLAATAPASGACTMSVADSESISNPNGIFILNGIGYIATTADNGKLFVMPVNPITSGSSYDVSNPAYDVSVSGSNAYITEGSSGVEVVNAANGQHAGWCTGWDSNLFAIGIYISGNYAYVGAAGGSTGGCLVVLSLANPSSPSVVKTISCGSMNSGGGGLCVTDDKIYLATDNTIDVFSISTPGTPGTPVSDSQLPITGAYDVHVYGSKIYVVAPSSVPSVTVRDLSNPTVVQDCYNAGSPYAIQFYEGYIYIVGPDNGLEKLNVGSVSGSLTVNLDAIPNNAQDFSFLGDLGPFTLDDDNGASGADGTYSNTKIFSSLAAGYYAFHQTVPSGWIVSSITASDASKVTYSSDGNSWHSTFTSSDTWAKASVQAGGSLTVTFQDTKVYSISGMKFFDLDGDGSKDAGESGLADWKIYCDGNNDGSFQYGETYALTDANGAYTLANLVPGTYNVKEVLKTGWTQTTPSGNLHTVSISNANVGDKNFGNRGTLSISGTKFNDLDGDGSKDAGESGLAGWKIYCDSNNDGSFQDTEISAITDANGAYTLAYLGPVTYNVREVQKAGWAQTAPAANLHTVVLTDANSVDKNFGNRGSLSISGTKFNDLDGDGSKDAGESGLAGWKIYCDNNNDSSFQDGEISAITDANGAYTLANLVPGTYNVREVQKAGWTQTTPSGNLHTVELTNANVGDKNFGNRGALSISGTKFNDLDGDGSKDAGESGLAGWKIYCDSNNDGSFQDTEISAITDANGVYTLAYLGPGTNNVREVLKAGWAQTTPAANLHSVVLTDANAVDKNFGNRGNLSISGTKFNDLDGDGSKDAGESGLADWKIYCDNNNDGSLQDTEISAITDANGAYTLANLVPGTYNVREVLKAGWAQTTPSGNLHTVELTDANAVDKNFANRGGLSISGTKFHDLDGDGSKDAGESGLAGWKIYCDSNNDGSFQDTEISAITDANGVYTLANLVPGTYNVREVLKSGWLQTTPSGNLHTVVLTDVNAVDKNFGNRGVLSISGMKFNDLDGDGSKDAGESGLAGWKIYCDSNNDGSFQDTEISAITDANGDYTLDYLGPGSYNVREVFKNGWTQTTPSGNLHTVELIDANAVDKDFANRGALSISGTKFNDLDGDGSKDAGESGLAGWKIYCDSNNDGSFQDTEISVITDANGAYTLTNLVPGTYNVREVLKNGWEQITPSGNLHTVVLTDAIAVDKNFGNRGTLSISGTKFNDLDGDGSKDAAESGLAGWKIYCDGNNDGSFQDGETYAITDANGDYILAYLSPGSYNVREVLKSGWTQTTPSGNLHTVELTNANAVDKNFGNRGTLSISGTKFNDLDGDGTKDAGESGLAGWKIYCDGNNDGSFQDGETYAITDANGDYILAYLGPGNYNVREVLKSGWEQTTPSGNLLTVELTNANAVDKNFGNRGALSISGMKFHDKNANGLRDDGEPPLSGWVIQLRNDTNGINLQTTITSAELGKEGVYEFAGLQPGTYRVYEVQKNGWVRTAPAGEYYTVTLTNMPSRGNIFGNNQLAITGLKFHDKNANGLKDDGEPPLSGWDIELKDESDNLLQTATTSSDPGKEGVYEFVDLQPGTYRVYEVQKNGWVRTAPAGEYHTVTLTNMPSRGNMFGNNQVKISGMKFEDLNGNGAKDAGEPGIDGWTIKLKKAGTEVDSTLTTTDGTYSFTGIAPGSYTVEEDLKADWIQSYPPSGVHTLTLASGEAGKSGLDFGNYRTTGLSGMKFEDLNANKAKNSGEPGLAGWTIRLMNGATEVAKTVTAADGSYSFTNIAPGSYTVEETAQSGWTQSYPASPGTHSVTLVSGIPGPNDTDFGNFWSTSLSGMKFGDLNGNGAKDSGEPGLEGWTIRLMNGATEVASTVTSSDGTYSFAGIMPGSYTVEEVSQAGWLQTYPAGLGIHSITLDSGVDGPTDLDFGNWKTTGFSGMKFEDLNANGAKDSGEPGLSGWTIRLMNGATEVDSTQTAADGSYSFTGVVANSYTVEEVEQVDWTQSYPASGTHAITLASGVDGPKDVDFGNWRKTGFSGMKFDDINGNGVKDSGEPGLEGWTIRLMKEGTEVANTVTVADGSYSFADIVPGSYMVEEVAQSDWLQTRPASPGIYSLNLLSGIAATNIDFGNFKAGGFAGIKFEDKNGNGVRDSGELGLSGWTIVLKKDGAQVASTQTAADGYYYFADVAPGSYTVEEIAQDGWTQTSPAGNVYTAVSSSGQVKITRADQSQVPATEANFGNRKLVEAFRVEIVADHQTVLPGESLVFTITINRVGDILLDSMSTQYTLPKGLKYISATPPPQDVIENGDGSTTLKWTDLAFSSFLAAQMGSSQSVSASPTDASTPSTTITVNSEVLSDAPPVLTGKVEVEGSTIDAEVAKDEDAVTVNVPSQHIYLNKTSDLKEVWPGATIGYTITYENLVNLPLTQVTITEQASSDLIFLSASPAPDLGTDNVWSIGDLASRGKGTINVFFLVKNTTNLSFLSQSSVSGSGFVSSYRRLSTETQSQGLRNSVTLTCKEFTPVSTSYFVKLRDSEGTSLLQTEHGSGDYRSEEISALKMQNRSISTAGSIKAVYLPTSFSLPGGKSINYNSEIASSTITLNRATQASTSQEVRYARNLEMDQRLLVDRNETLVSVEGSVQGQAHLGVLKKDGQAVKPSPVFESSQDYSGTFRFNQSLQDYGSNVLLIRNVTGQGQAASDQRLKKSQRSYEHGNGSYQSEQQASTAESYIAKDLSVSSNPAYGYGKWKSGIWSKSSGKSYLGQEISSADYIKEETKAGGLNDMSSNLSYRGQGRFRAVSEPDNRSKLDLDEEYVGEYSLQRKVHLGGVSRFDRPHITLNKTGWLVPGTVVADYTISVLNDGNTALGPVYVWDIFPAGTDYLTSSLKPTKLAGGYANWSLLYLGIGQSVTISLRLNLTDPQDELVNLVYASGGHNDEWVTAGNMSVMQFGWLGCCQPDLLMEKQARVDDADGRTIWYRILLQNRANVSLAAQVTDRLPGGLQFLNASAQPQVIGQNLVWVTRAIPAGQSRFIEYRAQATQNGRFVNTAQAEAHALDGSGGGMAAASATVTIGEATSYAEDGWRPPEWGVDRMEMICDDEIAGNGGSCGSCPSCSCATQGF